MSQDKAPELKIEKDEDLLEVYANNVFFESSVWDIKMLFGTLDQSKDQQISIHQHTAISIPWLQAKVMAYFLHLTRRSRNQTERDKSKSWTLSQSASNGPWLLNEKRYPKSFLPGNVMIPLDRY